MPNVIDEMHDWVADWAGVALNDDTLNDDTLNDMTVEELVDTVQRSYEGGVNQFMADNRFPGHRCQECGSDEHFSLKHS